LCKCSELYTQISRNDKIQNYPYVNNYMYGSIILIIPLFRNVNAEKGFQYKIYIHIYDPPQ